MSDELHVWTDAELKSAEDSLLRVAFERGRRAERERIRQRIEALRTEVVVRRDQARDEFAGVGTLTELDWMMQEVDAVLEALGGGDE